MRWAGKLIHPKSPQPQGGRLAGSCDQAKAEAHYRQAALPIKRVCADAVAKARLDFTYGKRGRLYVHEAKFEAGLVPFPKNAPFLPELEAELLTFPQGKTDDQVDSISQALSYEPGYNLEADCKRSFRAFALDGVDLLVFEQGRREATEFSVVSTR